MANADRRELRIAPVMTGGSSLAVWMGGVSAELYQLVTTDPSRADDASLYARLLEFTETEARIDVVTGTSAGGLNGSLISAAWARGLPAERFIDMRKTWLELGDISALLRSPNEANPPSLLRGDDYFRTKLEDVLDAWAIETEVDETERPTDRPIDLLITVTTIEPEPVFNEDDFGQELGETTHASNIRFRTGDFWTSDWTGQLATASRTSASIPGVFEPSYLRIGGESKRTQPSADLKGLASFDKSHWAVDGGVVVNLPLTEAIKRIFDQRAEGSLRRVILYIKPTPTIPAAFAGDDQDEAPTIFDAVATAITAPRAEGISEDLDVIRDHNLAVTRQEAARVEITSTPGRSISERAETLWSAYRTIHTVRSVSSMMDKAAGPVLTGALARRPDIEEAIRRGRANWLPDEYDAFGRQGLEWSWGLSPLENAIGVLLRLIGATLDLAPTHTTDTAALGVVRSQLSALYDELRALRAVDDAYWKFATVELSKIVAKPSNSPDWYDTVERWAQQAYEQWPFIGPSDSSGDARLARVQQTAKNNMAEAKKLLKDTPSDATDIVLDQAAILHRLRDLGGRIAIQALAAAADIRRLCLAASPTGFMTMQTLGTDEVSAAPEPVRIWHQYRQLIGSDADETLLKLLHLFVVDATLAGGRTTNSQYLEVMQVSWDAKTPLDRTRKPEDKLAGTELGRLGAFLKPSWRANDWFWGRLDGSSQLILLLLDPARLRQLGKTRDQTMELLETLATRGDPHLEAMWIEAREKVYGELEFLEPGSELRVPNTLPATAAAITYGRHVDIASVELGMVHDAIEQSTERGGVQGDEGYFKRLYAKKTKGGLDDPSSADTAELVRAMRIGQETATSELRGDLLTQSVSHTLAVATKGLSGERSGMRWLSRLLRPAQTSVLYGHAFVRLATTGSRLAQALTALALMAAAAILAMAITDNSIGPVWTTAAAAVFATALIFMAIRSGVWSIAPAALLFLVAGIALVGDDIEHVIADAPDERTAAIESNETIRVSEGTIVVTTADDSTERLTVTDAIITFDEAEGAVLVTTESSRPLDNTQQVRVASGSITITDAGAGPESRESLDKATITFSEDASVRLIEPDEAVRDQGWKEYGFTEGWDNADPVAVIVVRVLVAIWAAVVIWRTIGYLRNGGDPVSLGSWIALLVLGPLLVTTSPWLFDRLLTGDGESGFRGWVIDTAGFMEGHSFVVVLAVLLLVGLIIGLAWDKTGRRLFTMIRTWARTATTDAP